MTDADTAVLVTSADLHIRMGNRVELLTVRNALRTRVATLEGRLTKADTQVPHATFDRPPEAEFDPMPPRHVDLYLSLLTEYEIAHTALARANAAL